MQAFLANLLSDFLSELVVAIITAALVGSGTALFLQRRVQNITSGRQTHSPDGKRTAYESNGEIYVADQSGLRNLTHHRAKDSQPLFSPDGNWLAFATNRDGNGEIYIISLATNRLARLTHSPGINERPIRWTGNNLVVDLGGSALVIKEGEIRKQLGETWNTSTQSR